jgi:hypothetical protein
MWRDLNNLDAIDGTTRKSMVNMSGVDVSATSRSGVGPAQPFAGQCAMKKTSHDRRGDAVR